MTTEEKDRVRKEVERSFAELQQRLEENNPGVMDVLRVYGRHEEALRQADRYLGILGVRPRITASNVTMPAEGKSDAVLGRHP